MKTIRISLLSLFVLLINGLYSQDHIPFPTDNAKWVDALYNYNWSGDNPIPVLTLSNIDYYCVSGEDTSISGSTYTKIAYCNGAYKGAFRDMQGQVFYVPKDSTDEYLLFDFTVQAGETVSIFMDAYGAEIVDFNVDYVDSVLMNGVYRKRVGVGGGEWIEGIGNVQGLFADLGPNVSMYSTNLYCFSHNDTILYPYVPNNIGTCILNVAVEEQEKVQTHIYPNPTRNKLYISNSNHRQSHIELYDVTGQVVLKKTFNKSLFSIDLSEYPNGVYLLRQQIGNQIQTQKIVKY